MNNFFNGQGLKAIFFHDGEFRVGANCHSIIVVMERGQMSDVPWAIVRDYNKKILSKWNLAMVTGVEPL